MKRILAHCPANHTLARAVDGAVELRHRKAYGEPGDFVRGEIECPSCGRLCHVQVSDLAEVLTGGRPPITAPPSSTIVRVQLPF